MYMQRTDAHAGACAPWPDVLNDGSPERSPKGRHEMSKVFLFQKRTSLMSSCWLCETCVWIKEASDESCCVNGAPAPDSAEVVLSCSTLFSIADGSSHQLSGVICYPLLRALNNWTSWRFKLDWAEQISSRAIFHKKSLFCISWMNKLNFNKMHKRLLYLPQDLPLVPGPALCSGSDHWLDMRQHGEVKKKKPKGKAGSAPTHPSTPPPSLAAPNPRHSCYLLSPFTLF